MSEKYTNGHTTKRSAILPWAIVGVIALLALLGAAFFVTAQQSAGEQSTVQQSTDGDSGQSSTKDSSKIPTAEPVPTSEVPEVEVGQTLTLHITQWNKQVDISSKFGSTWYQLQDGNTKAQLNSALIDSLPESCAEMRTQFGFELAEDKLTVLKPNQTCAAATELYNEIWGLLDAAAKTAN